MDVAATLTRSAAFSHLTEAELAALAPRLAVERIAAGSVIVRQDDATHDAYLLAEGGVRIERETPFGRYVLAELPAGGLFGEASFVDAKGRSGDVLATVDSALVVFNHQALDPFLEEDDRLSLALYWAFWKSLSEKLRRANQHLVEFFTEPSGRPAPVAGDDRSPTGQFQVGIAAKKLLFEEQTLSPMEINFLTSLSKAKQLEPGEVIFREGEPGDRMYVVLEGRVMISKHIPGVGEEALAFLERGDYFGEMALIENLPRSAEAKAHAGSAVVLSIPRDVVAGVLDIRKVSSLRLLKLLCSLIAKRLREIDEKIVGWFMLAGGGAGAGRPPGR